MSIISLKRSFPAILLTLIYPLGGLIYCIKHIDLESSKNVFFLFCVYFGLVFIYFPEGLGVLGEGADSERYAVYLVQAYEMPDISFSQYMQIRGEGRFDYYGSFILYFVSRFTNNPHVFFCVVAIVMGFFYTKVIWMILKDSKPQDVYVKIFILFLILVAPIWKINGVRWWTGLYIFLYGVLVYLNSGKWYNLFWCLCSILIHYTFFYAVVVALVGLFLPDRKILPFVLLFIAVNVFNSFDISILENYIAALSPEAYAENTIGYLTFEYAEKANHNWFAGSARILTMYMNVFFVLLFYFRGKNEIEGNARLRKMFTMALLLASLCVIINMAPWGLRFLDLGNFFLYAFFCLALSHDSIMCKVRRWIKCSIPFVLYVILFQVREGFYCIGLFNLFLGNFFTAFWVNDNYPIIRYIDLLF